MTEGRVLKQRTQSLSAPNGAERDRRLQRAANSGSLCSRPPAPPRLVSASRRLATPAWALKGSPCHPVREQVSAVKVTLNKSRTLCFPDPFSTAVIGAPEIADLLPMTESMLYVQGKKVGATNISVFDQQRHLVSVIDLDVTPDTTSLQNKIAASTGGRDIAVTSANGEIVLSGEASDGLAAARAVEVAKGLSPDAQVVNAMKVSPSQQVMLKVRILEVDRDAGRDLGISWFGKTNSVSFATGLGSQPTTPRQTTAACFPGRAPRRHRSACCSPMSSTRMASASTRSCPRSRARGWSRAWLNRISSRFREKRRRFLRGAKFPCQSCRARTRLTARWASASTTRQTFRSNGSNSASASISPRPSSTTASSICSSIRR